VFVVPDEMLHQIYEELFLNWGIRYVLGEGRGKDPYKVFTSIPDCAQDSCLPINDGIKMENTQELFFFLPLLFWRAATRVL